MKTKLIYYILAVLTLGVSSCSSDFLKEYSQDLARVKSMDDLEELLVGDCFLPKGYYYLANSMIYDGNYNYAVLHFMGDELQEYTRLFNDPSQGNNKYRLAYFPYFTWQQNTYVDTSGKSTLESDENHYWQLGYTKINNCNMVIDAADQFAAATEDEQMRLRKVKGEAYFMRAFYYLTLVNLYANPYQPQTAQDTPGIPVKISAQVEDKEFQREFVAKVYQQILDDLTSAEKEFQNTSAPISIYHSGLEALYILRSRVALYMQDWQTAAEYAKKELDTDSYLFDLAALSANSYPLSKSNKEVLYSNGSSCFGTIIFPDAKKQSSWRDFSPTWYVSDNLYALFDDNDSRKQTYITTEDDVNNHLPTYHKIDITRSTSSTFKEVSDVFCIRTAEAYLNMAEAKAQLGEDAEACSYLNKLRKNRIQGATDIQLSGEELIQFIREERERELCFEGHRWFDLRRYMVDTKYPNSKTIEHTITYYAEDAYGDYSAKRVDRFRLEKNDAAYTLNIPKKVRDFQPSIGHNERPPRTAIQSAERPDEGSEDE